MPMSPFIFFKEFTWKIAQDIFFRNETTPLGMLPRNILKIEYKKQQQNHLDIF